MRVIVMIHGREAIPVRALPFLTNWETMNPGAIADALAHTNELHWEEFSTLTAFRLEGSNPKPIKASWWKNFPCRGLSAISAALRAQENAGKLTREQSYIEWRRQSILELPAGAFVWKDDFLHCYSRKYSPESIITIRDDRELSRDERASLYELDFEPYIVAAEVRFAVMDGFALGAPELPSAAALEAPAPAPVQRSAAQDAAILSSIAAVAPAVIPKAAAMPPGRVQQSAVQEAAIRSALQERGHDPRTLPVAAPGRAGVKAEIRAAIAVPPVFVSQKTFNDAWQRMRDHGDIADAS